MMVKDFIKKLNNCPAEYEIYFEDKYHELGLEDIAICTESERVEIRLGQEAT